MTSYSKVLLVLVILSCSSQTISAEDESTHSNKDAMTEVACTIYSVLDSCSSLLDSCDETCEKFREKCGLASVGSKYFPVICDNETMSKLLAFLRKGSPIKGSDVTWDKLKENPLHIVNYVMTNVVRQRLFSRMTSKIRRTLSSMYSKSRVDKGSGKQQKHLLKLETVVDLSCFLFTTTKSCSSHLSCENNNACRRISVVCDALSSYSRYLSTSCNVDVIYDIMEITDGVSERGKFKDVQLFWTEMFKSPALFMNRVANAMLKTVMRDSSTEISAVRENRFSSMAPKNILRVTSLPSTERTNNMHHPRILPVLSRDTNNSIPLRYSPFLVLVLSLLRI